MNYKILIEHSLLVIILLICAYVAQLAAGSITSGLYLDMLSFSEPALDLWFIEFAVMGLIFLFPIIITIKDRASKVLLNILPAIPLIWFSFIANTSGWYGTSDGAQKFFETFVPRAIAEPMYYLTFLNPLAIPFAMSGDDTIYLYAVWIPLFFAFEFVALFVLNSFFWKVQAPVVQLDSTLNPKLDSRKTIIFTGLGLVVFVGCFALAQVLNLSDRLSLRPGPESFDPVEVTSLGVVESDVTESDKEIDTFRSRDEEEIERYPEDVVPLDPAFTDMNFSGVIYQNDMFGFMLTFPDTWDGFYYEEKLGKQGADAYLQSVRFGYAEQATMFYVNVYSTEEWVKMLEDHDSQGTPIPAVLGMTNELTFTYQVAQDSEYGLQREEVFTKIAPSFQQF